jgi:hypothetical protein
MNSALHAGHCNELIQYDPVVDLLTRRLKPLIPKPLILRPNPYFHKAVLLLQSTKSEFKPVILNPYFLPGRALARAA